MADEVVAFSWRRQFPVLRLFEAATIALSPFSILVAALTVVFISTSSLLIDWSLTSPLPQQSVKTSMELDVGPGPGSNVIPSVTAIQSQPSPPITFLAISNSPLLQPWFHVTEPAVSLWDALPFNGRLNRFLKFAIALSAWSVVGTILARRAAFLVAGMDDVGLKSTVDFGLVRWPASVGAPLIPLASAFLLSLVLMGMGLVGRLPWLGPIWLIGTSPVAAMIGFVIAFLLLVTAVSWPLMIASIATDDCDSFGGLSRAYSGLTSKPWHMLLYLILGSFAGLCFLTVVQVFAETTIWCAIQGIGLTSGVEPATKSLAAPLTSIVSLFVSGAGASFFWSMATMISLLLRQEVDGAPLDRITNRDALGQTRDPLPVVGMPATDARPPANGQVSAESGST